MRNGTFAQELSVECAEVRGKDLADALLDLGRRLAQGILRPAYLVAGAALDRAMLLGTLPPEQSVLVSASAGVETFLARYQAPGGPEGSLRMVD